MQEITKSSSLTIIKNDVKSLAQLQQESIEKYGHSTGVIKYEPEEPIRKVEFVMNKGYIICNVLYRGRWKTSSWPDNVTIIEFLMAGTMANAHMWPDGRPETNE